MKTMALLKQDKGLTLVELLIVVAISGIIFAAMSAAFQAQQRHANSQMQVLDIQQNSRAALDLMVNEIRMAGYDPTFTKLFGITDISFRNLDNNLDANGNSAITFTADMDETANPANQIYAYSLFDFNEGTPDVASRDLGRATNGGGPMLLAENIAVLGLAYAYDADGDGNLDTMGGNTIWGIDQNNDNTWDNLDTDNDGDIDAADAGGATNAVINAMPTGTAINFSDIRMVRIWLLARSDRREPGFVDQQTYVAGRQVITPSGIADEQNNGGFRYRLLEATVVCRNLGL